MGTPPREKGCNHAQLTLRAVREVRGLSLRDVERETGISRAHLSKVERGIEVPKPKTLVALSDHYGVDSSCWELHVEYRLPSAAVADINP